MPDDPANASSAASEAEDAPSHQIRAKDYVAPVLKRKAFHCPHCNVYAPQEWDQLDRLAGTSRTHSWRGECFNCKKLTYWISDSVASHSFEDSDAILVWPLGSTNAPSPHPDMPEKPKADYEEARAIVDRSPRGGAALLRLAVQELCTALGEPGKKINDDIASLVQKGLDPLVQKALDSLRVIGNNAVHPGQIDLKDDRDTATALFGLLNYIVEQQITRPKNLQAIYDNLPESARKAIEKRDA